MVRFLCFLFGKVYEPCKSCETLKQQLSFANEEKRQLTDTLINILQPKAIEQAPVEINSIMQTSALFSRRRAALESKDREEAKIRKNSELLGKSDDRIQNSQIEQLENEVGISGNEA